MAKRSTNLRGRGGASTSRSGSRGAIRFAVVGAGHIAQEAVLPAFQNTRGKCELTCVFSDDARKRRVIADEYDLEHVLDYKAFDAACQQDIFDAVYIALPNSMHRSYTERAAAAGIHVLCEKPLASTSADCAAMIKACRRNDVRLMTAYRLHFEPSTIEAMRIARRGPIGQARIFSSVFTMQVKPKNIRLDADLGGGPMMDIGIYCINAARYLFDDEPIEVCGFSVASDDSRFREVPEAVSAVLRFPGDRLASFTCSFGASATGWCQVVGTKGDLCIDPAYEYQEGLEHHLTVDDRTKRRKFSKSDQFAPELLYFAECIKRGKDPEPGGEEGMIDVLIIEAIRESAKTGRKVRLGKLPADPSVAMTQKKRVAPARGKKKVRVSSAHS